MITDVVVWLKGERGEGVPGVPGPPGEPGRPGAVIDATGREHVAVKGDKVIHNTSVGKRPRNFLPKLK